MFRKKSFPIVFNVLLDLIIALVFTTFTQLAAGTMSVPTFTVAFIYGFSISFAVTTMIDLNAFGDWFLKKFNLKMESPAGYFVKIFFVALLMVFIMSLVLMFCEIFFLVGPAAFFVMWIQRFPVLFLVAYVTVLIFFIPCIKITQALCTRD